MKNTLCWCEPWANLCKQWGVKKRYPFSPKPSQTSRLYLCNFVSILLFSFPSFFPLLLAHHTLFPGQLDSQFWVWGGYDWPHSQCSARKNPPQCPVLGSFVATCIYVCLQQKTHTMGHVKDMFPFETLSCFMSPFHRFSFKLR